MRSDSDLHETRTNAEQSETAAEFRVTHESQGAHLYFIKIAKGRAPVKIGRANKPLVRLATLQVANPYTLKLIGVLEDCGTFEFAFHSYLAKDRLRGEWFGWSKKVETVVRLAIDGGDWQSKIAERDPVPAEWEGWQIGSPLYAGNPKYPEFQLPAGDAPTVEVRP